MGIYNIAVVGSGVVGSATGKGFHKLGHKVVFFDISKKRLSLLKEEGYAIASSVKDAISQSDISFVCVNTPTNKNDDDAGKHQDLSQLSSALRDISNALGDGPIRNKKHLLVFRSTMLPGTIRNVVIEYLERNCNLKRGTDYDILYNPEFLRQNSALGDFFSPDRVVIGEGTPKSSHPLSEIYRPLTKNILITGYEESEMIKYAANCFLALKISYFNEISMICKSLGIDDSQVGLGVSLDRRIGKYGTEGGRPFGGACLPKDIKALVSFASRLNVKPDLLKTTIEVNRQIEELSPAKQEVNRQIEELSPAKQEVNRQIEELSPAKQEVNRQIEELSPAKRLIRDSNQ